MSDLLKAGCGETSPLGFPPKSHPRADGSEREGIGPPGNKWEEKKRSKQKRQSCRDSQYLSSAAGGSTTTHGCSGDLTLNTSLRLKFSVCNAPFLGSSYWSKIAAIGARNLSLIRLTFFRSKNSRGTRARDLWRFGPRSVEGAAESDSRILLALSLVWLTSNPDIWQRC